jgi:effector-binding domain-containing protein
MRPLLIFLTGLLFACSGEKKEQQGTSSLQDNTSIGSGAPANKNIEGVYSVPEMLCVSIKDTANAATIASRLQEDFTILQEEVEAMKIKNPGNQGLIMLTNTPDNFIFRCVIPIDGIPLRTPEKASMFVLEGTRAVVYNYYGPYDKMTQAYKEIKDYMDEHKLIQSGPPREFYITDPALEKDTAKWFSKIYIPVR